MVQWSIFNTILDVFSLISALITVTLATSMYYNHCKYPNQMNETAHKRVASLSLTCYAIAMITMSICYNIIGIDNQTSANYVYSFLFFVWFWGMGLCSSYWLFTLRLKTIFKYSDFETSKSTECTLYSSLILWVICHTILIIISLLRFYGVISVKTKEFIHFTQLTAKCLLCIYLAIALTYLFVSKLMRIRAHSYQINDDETKSTVTVSNPSHNTAPSSSRLSKKGPQIQLQVRDIMYLSSATKMAVLTMIMVSSSTVLMVVALSSVFSGHRTAIGAILWYFNSMLGLMVDSVINSFCIYLTFPYSSSLSMYRCLCKPTLHRAIFYCAKSNFQSKISNKRESMRPLELMDSGIENIEIAESVDSPDSN